MMWFDYLCGGMLVFLFFFWLIYETTCFPNRHRWVLDKKHGSWYREHCTKCNKRRLRFEESEVDGGE